MSLDAVDFAQQGVHPLFKHVELILGIERAETLHLSCNAGDTGCEHTRRTMQVLLNEGGGKVYKVVVLLNVREDVVQALGDGLGVVPSRKLCHQRFLRVVRGR